VPAGLQDIAIFGIDDSDATHSISQLTATQPIRGHFWPMEFFVGQAGPYSPTGTSSGGQMLQNGVYMTTMNRFASPQWSGILGSDGTATPYERGNGGNYFRVGPFGTEMSLMWMRKQFQAESSNNPPNRIYYNGFLGPISGADKPTVLNTDNFGIVAWGNSSLVMSSEYNIAQRSVGTIYLEAGCGSLAQLGSTTSGMPPNPQDPKRSMLQLIGYTDNPLTPSVFRSVNGISIIAKPGTVIAHGQETIGPYTSSSPYASGLFLPGDAGNAWIKDLFLVNNLAQSNLHILLNAVSAGN